MVDLLFGIFPYILIEFLSHQEYLQWYDDYIKSQNYPVLYDPDTPKDGPFVRILVKGRKDTKELVTRFEYLDTSHGRKVELKVPPYM